ncbi:protein YkwD [Porphyridium purpureum]|uniref:Protein YkwD n=1 Tax=Porphyridium purpureum TaxID=35688 RepID=A0A5J4YYF3_PORPP|nr:protein YkwD [Porphyridium purpureum]|eukprot:POR3024..scf208_2
MSMSFMFIVLSVLIVGLGGLDPAGATPISLSHVFRKAADVAPTDVWQSTVNYSKVMAEDMIGFFLDNGDARLYPSLGSEDGMPASRWAYATLTPLVPQAPQAPQTPQLSDVPAEPVHNPQFSGSPQQPDTPATPPQQPGTPATPPQQPGTPAQEEPTGAGSGDAEGMAQAALQYTNDFRAQQGMEPLAYDATLVSLALAHSQSMPSTGFQHSDLSSLTAPGLFVAAENIAMSSDTSDPARGSVDQWIGSPGHAQNMAGPYTHCGVGIFIDGSGYWATQIFGTAS